MASEPRERDDVLLPPLVAGAGLDRGTAVPPPLEPLDVPTRDPPLLPELPLELPPPRELPLLWLPLEELPLEELPPPRCSERCGSRLDSRTTGGSQLRSGTRTSTELLPDEDSPDPALDPDPELDPEPPPEVAGGGLFRGTAV